MKVTVVAFNATEVHKAEKGLVKLKRGVEAFRKDLKDCRVDVDTIESFTKGLRIIADYFDGFVHDEPEVDSTKVEVEDETDY